jgi:hypothetical protein
LAISANPAGRRPDPLADHQLEIHRPRHHQKTDEDRADNGLPVKALFKVRGRRQQVAVFGEFFIVVHGSSPAGR